MSTITERVAAGSAFLDEREPGWDQRIDLGTFDLCAPCNCVLGQLLTDFAGDGWGVVLSKFGLRRTWHPGPALTDVELGFNADDADEEYEEYEEYEALTAEWKRVITARREAAP